MTNFKVKGYILIVSYFPVFNSPSVCIDSYSLYSLLPYYHRQ